MTMKWDKDEDTELMEPMSDESGFRKKEAARMEFSREKRT